jgi:long-subunit acyl-CoA synthetase (AMP-forming)
MGLAPQVDHEGHPWKFIGIQAKNSHWWYSIHLANMHIGATTIAFYDTLGQAAQKYICNQT